MKIRNLFAGLAALLILSALAPEVKAATSDTLNVRVSGVWASKLEAEEVIVDFAAHAAQTTNSLTRLFDIQPREVVLGVSAQVITAEGATCTAKVGTNAAGEASYFTAALNLNSEAWTWIPAGTANGKAYSAATWLRLTHNHVARKAKVRFRKWSLKN